MRAASGCAPVWAVLAAVSVAAQAQAQTQAQAQAQAQSQAQAQTQAQGPGIQDSGEQQLDRFLEETRTLRAEFSQELLDSSGQLIETASGTFSLKRPNRFHWSYREPYEQQVVADAVNLWIYDAELEQATVTPLAGAIASSPAMLLSGDRNVRDSFEIVESVHDGQVEWIGLAPKEQGADFGSVYVGFASGSLFALELVDALGQITSIQFRNVMVNLDIEDEFFQFEPPAGADVIGEPVELPQ